MLSHLSPRRNGTSLVTTPRSRRPPLFTRTHLRSIDQDRKSDGEVSPRKTVEIPLPPIEQNGCRKGITQRKLVRDTTCSSRHRSIKRLTPKIQLPAVSLAPRRTYVRRLEFSDSDPNTSHVKNHFDVGPVTASPCGGSLQRAQDETRFFHTISPQETQRHSFPMGSRAFPPTPPSTGNVMVDNSITVAHDFDSHEISCLSEDEDSFFLEAPSTLRGKASRLAKR